MGWETLLGAGAGFLIGGPAGMSIGASLGGALGEATGGGVSGAAEDAAAAAAAASDRSAQLQRETAKEQLELQRRVYEESVARQKPFYDVGVNALPELVNASRYTPFGMDQFQQDPGYAFRLKEGQKALERSAAARGGLISGGALKAAQQYGQEMGSQEYLNAFNRYQTERAARLNPLQSLTGMGQTTANTLGAAGQNYATGAGNIAGTMASNVGNIYTQQGINQGNAMITGAQARATSYGNTADLLGRFYGGGGSGTSGSWDPASGTFRIALFY
jgi:hypothetical protein